MKKKLALLAVLSGLFVNAQSWSLTGNSGTTPGTNFIGTTDNQNLVFKTNNQERLKIDANGRFGFNLGYINPNYSNTFVGNHAFFTSQDQNSFIIDNEDGPGPHLRADGEYNILFLEEKGVGKVVIGTNNILQNCASCADYKLFVKDGIRTEKVKVDIAASNGWADYVFKKDYQLMPLKEVEHFINNNGHLPEVPSTEEAIKNGIELKEMNILLLKKIEELTLYTIEQQKRIEALEKKVK